MSRVKVVPHIWCPTASWETSSSPDNKPKFLACPRSHADWPVVKFRPAGHRSHPWPNWSKYYSWGQSNSSNLIVAEPEILELSWVQIRTQIIEIRPKTIFSDFSHERLVFPKFQGVWPGLQRRSMVIGWVHNWLDGHHCPLGNCSVLFLPSYSPFMIPVAISCWLGLGHESHDIRALSVPPSCHHLDEGC